MNLYDEFKIKCNPANYLNPYNAEKVDISNSIYSQLDSNKNSVDLLILLRNQAINQLGISFSAKIIYEKLCSIYNPANFIGDNYNPEKLYAANKIYSIIQQNKDIVIELEKIVKENVIPIKKWKLLMYHKRHNFLMKLVLNHTYFP